MNQRVFGLVVWLLVGPAFSASHDPQISEFLKFAEQNDPNLKKIFKDRDKLKYLVDLGLPSRKFLLEAEGEQGANSDTSAFSGTLSKELVETGTQLAITHSQATRPDRKEDVTEFRIEQDLYKNIFGRDVRLKKASLENEEQVVRLEVLEAYEVYLKDLLEKYLDFQKAHLDFALAGAALQEAKRLKSNLLLKKKNKIASQTDLDKASLQVILREEDLALRQTELNQVKETLRQIIGDLSRVHPSLQVFEAVLNFYDHMKNVSPHTQDLRSQKILQIRKKIRSSQLTLAQRESQPDLSLVAGYDVDKSRRFSSTVNREEAIVGLKVEMPLWDTQAEANVKSSSLEHSKAELELEIGKRQIETERMALQLKIQELQNKRNLLSEKVKISERIIKDEKRRYQYGKIDLDTLIELEKGHIAYRFQKQSGDLEFGKAMLQWLALNDQLLQLREQL